MTVKELKTFKVPKERIRGQRFGQLIYNAIRGQRLMPAGDLPDVLWEISNKDLQKLIDKLLKEI